MKKNWLIAAGIAIVLYFIFLYHLGYPALLDSDETRYADIARGMMLSGDYITPCLDGKIFWDKPPLFFWMLVVSYKILGISELSVRLPSVFCALAIITALFFAVKKTSSTKNAAICSLILASSVEFVIFARISILDMLFSTNIFLSVICGLMTYFTGENKKKYLWWLFYIFSALGVLTKGIPAVIIPFGIMLAVGIWKKNLKEFFKPEYFIIGSMLFLLTALPWHILMYKLHGFEFIQQYIIKHHFQRFIGCEEIGRKHSFIYYIPTFIVGFLPWTLSFLFGLKKLVKDKNNDFIIMNFIGFVFILLFFSCAGTKLITYILPLYPMAAVLCGYMWVNQNFDKEINLSILYTNSAFVIFAILVAFAGLYLTESIYNVIRPVQIPIVMAFLICSVFTRKNTALISYLILISFLSGIMLPRLLNIWYEFGENELISYAKFAKENKLSLGAYNLWERFSLQYYYAGDIEYFQEGDAYGAKYVNTTKLNNSFNQYIVVIPNDSMEKIKFKYNIIKKGKRYSLIGDNNE